MSTDLADWEGDVEELRGSEDVLLYGADLCGKIFESKHEAFSAGFALGRDRTGLPGSVIAAQWTQASCEPEDPRGVVLAIRADHLEGNIEPTDSGLDELLRPLPYTESEITYAFDGLVDLDCRTAGGVVSLEELPEEWELALRGLGLIITQSHGVRQWTKKGADMQNLIDAYSSPTRLWRRLT